MIIEGTGWTVRLKKGQGGSLVLAYSRCIISLCLVQYKYSKLHIFGLSYVTASCWFSLQLMAHRDFSHILIILSTLLLGFILDH